MKKALPEGESVGEKPQRRDVTDVRSVFLVLWWFYLFRPLWFVLDHQIEELPQKYTPDNGIENISKNRRLWSCFVIVWKQLGSMPKCRSEKLRKKSASRRRRTRFSRAAWENRQCCILGASQRCSTSRSIGSVTIIRTTKSWCSLAIKSNRTDRVVRTEGGKPWRR